MKHYIDYAITFSNQNSEYKDNLPFIRKRFNDIGIKVIEADVYEDETYEPILEETDYGYYCKVGSPRISNLVNYFTNIMTVRFYIACMDKFKDKIMLIYDGDLLPINQHYLINPSIKYNNYEELIISGKLIVPNMYAPDNMMSCNTIGLGSTFSKILPHFNSLHELVMDIERVARKIGHMYMNDEDWMNFYLNNYPVKDDIIRLHNRIQLGNTQDNTTLYPYEIDGLTRWQDLAPFIDFHQIRTSDMNESRWSKLFKLLEEYDKYELTNPCYYYEASDDVIHYKLLTNYGIKEIY